MHGPKHWFAAWAMACHRGLGLFYHLTKQRVLYFYLIYVLLLKTGFRIRKNMRRTTALLMLQNRGACFYVSQNYPLSCWTPSKCLTGANQPLQVPLSPLMSCLFSLLSERAHNFWPGAFRKEGTDHKWSMVIVTYENWAVFVSICLRHSGRRKRIPS